MSNIRIFVAGDYCASNPNNIQISDELKSVIDSCDVRCLNFEGPLSSNEWKAPNNTRLRQSDLAPAWCESYGFQVVGLANNHLRDYGEQGIVNTINAFSDSITLGAGNWAEAYTVKYLDVGGKRIGFFAASSADLASLQDKWTDVTKLGSAWINHHSVNDIISDAKTKCDYLVAFVHAGVEYMNIPLPEWRDRYKDLVDNGVDAIMGSHPHVIQGWENYKNHPIFYSLGNFFFDFFFDESKKPKQWDNGMAVVLNFEENGRISVEPFLTKKIGNVITIDTTEESLDYFNSLCDILKDEKDYLSQVNEEVLNFYHRYMSWLLAGLSVTGFDNKGIKNKVRSLFKVMNPSVPNYSVALNQIREESSRYVLIRALRLMSNR